MESIRPRKITGSSTIPVKAGAGLSVGAILMLILGTVVADHDTTTENRRNSIENAKKIDALTQERRKAEQKTAEDIGEIKISVEGLKKNNEHMMKSIERIEMSVTERRNR
jgi:esterase/lipase